MSSIPIEQAFDLAVEHHQAGRLHEAEAIYRQIVALDPGHADALHLLGVAELQLGRAAESVQFIRRAVAIDPQAAAFHCNLGQALESTGDVDQAIAEYRAALALMPRYAEAHSNLGNALLHKGFVDDAIASYRRALEIRPGYPGALYNLGVAQLTRGEFQGAIDALTPVVNAQPENLDARSNLGNALAAAGRTKEAVLILQAVALVRVQSADAHYNLGAALLRDGQFERAILSLRQSLQLRADSPETLSNLGSALHELRRLDESIDAYRQAQRLAPDDPQIHFNLGLTLLLKGDFENGWPEHEWRWQTNDLAPLRREFDRPQWDGGDLRGKRILVYTEQGFGDAIQFFRYLPLLRQRGAQVILECQPELIRLFRDADAADQVIARAEPLPTFDLHCPLLSLPNLFHTTLDSIPAAIPYLSADPHDVEAWRSRLAAHSTKPKVGIAWAGRPQHRNDQHRSVRLEVLLSALNAVEGIQFVSLQKGTPSAELEDAREPILDHTNELHDFFDTAALISALDLVVSVDTAVAHLAGAMGKPVWVLLPYVPDWRWLLDRGDSPWYPTMKLFRQKSLGDWSAPMIQLAEALRCTVSEKS